MDTTAGVLNCYTNAFLIAISFEWVVIWIPREGYRDPEGLVSLHTLNSNILRALQLAVAAPLLYSSFCISVFLSGGSPLHSFLQFQEKGAWLEVWRSSCDRASLCLAWISVIVEVLNTKKCTLAYYTWHLIRLLNAIVLVVLYLEFFA